MINELITDFTEKFAQSQTQLQYTEAGIAAALVLGSILLGWTLSRIIAPKLAEIWETRAGYESELARRRIRDMVRRLTEVVIIALVLVLWDWTLIANVIFASTLAIASGLLTNDFIRGVRMPNWLGTLMGVGVALAVMASRVGSIEEITVALDQVGFDLGEGRISLLKIVTVIFTGVLLFAVARIVGRIVSHSISSSSQFDATQKLLGQKIATIVIVIIAFFVGIDVLGIDLTALAFFSGAFGLAIGFGMQKTIGNLIAGIILLMDRSIKPGDVIVVGDSFGWVNKIGVRAVSVLTRDGKEHLIPNENLMINEVENWSYSDPNVRMKIDVGVAYNSDMRKVQELLYQAVRESKRVLKRPAPVVWMLEFGDNSVNFQIRCWINDPQDGIGNVRGNVMMRVWELFQEHNIEIPFPQRDLYIKELPDGFNVKEKIEAAKKNEENGSTENKTPATKGS
ncbi:mechanosensitive ion channel domain-containing protein [Sphingorhabdus sp. Alg239-R122]|uniref:mechanosensitive ion channel family protein n=1 Tax=Sphingorhabdus sp. Alg239-R122 TaxID=2305989 RepID=UPI0013DD41B9|nr:mechanosensitive ion channel domain-containing protein [Sphingorhabdus sp. Alg239-R122]